MTEIDITIAHHRTPPGNMATRLPAEAWEKIGRKFQTHITELQNETALGADNPFISRHSHPG
jgi:hypothetical protein